MTNKILGLSVLVALVGALAALTPLLYRTLLSHESNVVYAMDNNNYRPEQQTIL
jgi:predicted membrane-bound mannosyltransferase